MQRLPKLNFPACRLRAVRREGVTLVWDPLRRTYLVLTPEEWVRRHLVAYLCTHRGADALRIRQEYPVPLNGTAQRADVVVCDAQGRPLLLAECKAPDVPLTEGTLAQAVRYNSVAGARYVLLTNGMEHRCYERSGERYRLLPGIPDL